MKIIPNLSKVVWITTLVSLPLTSWAQAPGGEPGPSATPGQGRGSAGVSSPPQSGGAPAAPSGAPVGGAPAARVAPQSGGAPAAPSAPAPAEDDLEAQLRAAAAADAAERAEATGVATSAAPSAVTVHAPALSPGVSFYDNSSNPAISFILDTAGFWYSADRHVNHGGHVYNHVGPAIQGVELAASTNVDPFFKAQINMGLYHGHIEEAFATTTALPWNLQVRAGKYKTRLGRRNHRHLHQWNFVDQPIVTEYLFGPEGLSMAGSEVSVLLPLPWYAELVLSIQGGEDTRSHVGTGIDGPGDLIYSPRLEQFFDLNDDTALMVGLNGSMGRSPLPKDEVTDNRTWIYGLDWTLKYRPIGSGATGFFFVEWTNEVWLRELEVPGDLWRDMGGYSELLLGIDKEWQAAFRFDFWRRLDGPGPGEPHGRDVPGTDTMRGEVALSYSPSHFSRVRLQYGLEDADTYDLDHVVMLQLEVSAGSHGAHTY